MRTSSFLRLLAQTACFLASFGLAHDCQAAETLPDLDTVRNQVREYHSSIQSIHVRFNHWNNFDPQRKSGDGPDYGPQKMEWAEQGTQKLLFVDALIDDRHPGYKIHVSHDSDSAYYVDFDPHDLNLKTVRTIFKAARINDVYDQIPTLPAHFCGLRVPMHYGSLLDLLSLESAVLVGREDVDGASCLHAKVSDVKDAAGLSTGWNIWLDEAKEYLPRRMSFKYADDAWPKNSKFKNSDWLYEVRQYVQVEDGLLNRLRWFPSVMVHSSSLLTWRLETETVEINGKIPKAKFQPEMPVGTLVVEGEQIPHMPPPKSYVVGGGNAVAKLVDKQLDAATNLKIPGPLVDASRATGWNWTVILGVVCSLSLVGTLGWRFTFKD